MFFDALMEFIAATWPELTPEKIPFVFPTCYELKGNLRA